MNKCLSSTRPAALNHKTIKYKRKKKSSSVVWWLLRTAEFHYPNYHYIYRSLSKTQVVFRKHNLDFIIGILRFPFDFRLLSIFRSVFTVFFFKWQEFKQNNDINVNRVLVSSLQKSASSTSWGKEFCLHYLCLFFNTWQVCGSSRSE